MDPRVDHLEERMSRVEGKLDRMAETLAGLPKRGEFWALAIAGFGAIAATLAVGLAAMNNQLAAFQAGLGANQATRAEPSAPAAPIIINIPPAASTPPQPPAQ
ncbi:MAG TPA: hypothetical protein VGN96_03915 [Roseococcus sp.]|jgi:hypothetical protein|nr:hypothetical protein [Roseococcus sp.]